MGITLTANYPGLALATLAKANRKGLCPGLGKRAVLAATVQVPVLIPVHDIVHNRTFLVLGCFTA